jgi:hypothetical protein
MLGFLILGNFSLYRALALVRRTLRTIQGLRKRLEEEACLWMLTSMRVYQNMPRLKD